MSKSTTATHAWFEVYIVTIVDRPERRNDSYTPVPAGHKIVERKQCATQREAVALFNEAVSGEWDSGSEYVSACCVTQHFAMDVTGRMRGSRTVRARVERDTARAAYDEREAQHEAEMAAWRARRTAA